MERKLTDALIAQIDTGQILTREETTIEWQSSFVITPNRADIDEVQRDVWKKLLLFQDLARKFCLPTHNAVAFFSAAIEKEPSLKAEQRSDFKQLLHLALCGQGFVFGTSFDSDRNFDLRPSDHIFGYPPANKDFHLFGSGILNQVRLSGAYFFLRTTIIVK